MEKEKTNIITIHTDTTELDEALEKANRLKELLVEVQELICSLGDINRKDC